MRILAQPDSSMLEPPREPIIRTGIRRTNTGGWAAIRNGRLVGDYHGIGSKAAAIRKAGTNRSIA